MHYINKKNIEVAEWNNLTYKDKGFYAQRFYPNEELLRFFGRNLFNIPVTKRAGVKILELGCGSCSNLWVVAKEGFSAYGIDISSSAIDLGYEMLKKWSVSADLIVGDATILPYEDNMFDVVFDVFSLCSLTEDLFLECVENVARVIKKDGKFFSYTPSKKSDAFLNYKPSHKIDNSTLDGIKRQGSPFFGNNYPFRFISPEEYARILKEKGFRVNYSETVAKTYGGGKEYFEFIVVEAVKV